VFHLWTLFECLLRGYIRWSRREYFNTSMCILSPKINSLKYEIWNKQHNFFLSCSNFFFVFNTLFFDTLFFDTFINLYKLDTSELIIITFTSINKVSNDSYILHLTSLKSIYIVIIYLNKKIVYSCVQSQANSLFNHMQYKSCLVMDINNCMFILQII